MLFYELPYVIIFNLLTAKKVEWAVDDLRSYYRENGVQVCNCATIFIGFPSCSATYYLSLLICALGLGEMSQLWKEQLSLMQIVQLPYLRWISSKIHFFLIILFQFASSNVLYKFLLWRLLTWLLFLVFVLVDCPNMMGAVFVSFFIW